MMPFPRSCVKISGAYCCQQGVKCVQLLFGPRIAPQWWHWQQAAKTFLSLCVLWSNGALAIILGNAPNSVIYTAAFLEKS